MTKHKLFPVVAILAVRPVRLTYSFTSLERSYWNPLHVLEVKPTGGDIRADEDGSILGLIKSLEVDFTVGMVHVSMQLEHVTLIQDLLFVFRVLGKDDSVRTGGVPV